METMTKTTAPLQAPPTRRIVVARVAGFCFGVKRAMDMVEAARRERPEAITMLGPLVHNQQVIGRMEREGVGTAAHLEAISEGTVVLSAHGVAPAIPLQARAQGLNVLDATCPFVTKVHRMAKRLREQNYQILLVGDAGHTEVRGVTGAVEALGGTVYLVASVAEVRGLTLGKKVGIISQTTQQAATFAAIVAEVCRTVPDVRALNTICGATDALQEAAADMARQAEVAIVIGGRSSANTRRLRDLCEAQGVPAYHIETADEILPEWIAESSVIGLTAGASTPDWIIEDVARRLNGGSLPDDWRLDHPEE